MNRRDFLAVGAAAASGGLRPPLAFGADSPDEAIHKYLATEVERLSKNELDGAKSKDAWLAKRPQLQQQFLDMAGLWPLPEKTDLKAKVTGTFDVGNVTIENLHYQSKPGLYVTGNLYRPTESKKKLPAILYVCGHSGKGRDGNKTAFQDHGLWFASNGYVCLVVDTLQLGEVAGKHHGTYNLDRFWWHSRGYTPAGVELWNGIRGIDYLLSRPEVDPAKIGVTGISGGGATTVWVAAADDRVKVAVPVSGMSDLQSYVTDNVINGHCDCMFVYNLYRWEWTTILALFAPKPLLFANSDNDSIFPMDGNRRIVARLRKLYEMLGKKDLVDEYVSKGGHAYRPDLRVAIFGFINKHLKGDTGPIQDAKFDEIPGRKLRAFPDDADLPQDSINHQADESFVPVAEVKLPEAKDFKEWRAGLVKQLKEKALGALPPAVPTNTFHERKDGQTLLFDGEVEGGVRFRGYLLQESNGAAGGTLIVLNPDDEYARAAAYWSKHFPDDGLTLAVYPRGGGPLPWARKNPPNTVERSMALIGRTVDTGRVWDVVSFSMTAHGRPLRLAGRGPAGILGAYATFYTIARSGKQWVNEVVLIDPPVSHREGPHFLGVQRVLDIPEALGLLAPDVKLTLLGKNAKDKAFDKTAAIYKLAGAADKFTRK